jgi:hypothetical protein
LFISDVGMGACFFEGSLGVGAGVEVGGGGWWLTYLLLAVVVLDGYVRLVFGWFGFYGLV